MNVQSGGRKGGQSGRHDGLGRVVSLMGGLLWGLVACAAAPAEIPIQPSAEPPPPVPSTRVYVYPAAGQSPEQLDRDRYECYLWAVKQTGYDPSAPQAAPHQRVEVVPMPPPGTSTAAGAITGAVIGAAVSHPHDAAGGAAVGAVAGAIIGSASDAARQQQAERVQQVYDQRQAAEIARLERQSNDYRRAVSACLEGRGYTVK